MARTFDDFEIVVARKDVYARHRCFDKGMKGAGQTALGQIICCKECGRHYVCFETWLESNRRWKPVRWYHFKMRRAILGK